MKSLLDYISATLVIAVILFLSSCGEYASIGSGGALHIVVKGAQSFNPLIEHGRIVTYRVTVTASELDPPLVAEFSGDAQEGIVSDVPIGNDIKVVVEAINPNGLVIREGEKQNISVEGGKIAEAEVNLQSVPIFANIADGNTIDNTRLVFKVFSSPTSVIVVEEITNDVSAVLLDASTSSSEFNVDATTGLGKMIPELQAPGLHSYKVRDVNTGRSSIISVILTDGTKRKGAPFFGAGDHSDPYLRRRLSSGTALLPFVH